MRPMSRRPIRTLCLALSTLLLRHATGDAQQANTLVRSIDLAAYASLVGGQSGSFTVYAGDSCGTFADATAADRGIGVVGTFRLSGGLIDDIALGIGYRNISATYVETPGGAQRLFDPGTAEVIELDREFRFDAITHYLDIQLQPQFAPFEGLRIGAGIAASLALGGSFMQTDVIMGPKDRSFSDGERVHAMDFGISVSRSPVVLGLSGSAGYDVPIGGALITPVVQARANLTSTVREASWQAWSAGVGVSLRIFHRDTAAPPPPPPPPLPDPPVAAIVAEGIDDDGRAAAQATISVREVLLIRSTPLVTSVFFDSAVGTLPVVYSSLNRIQADRFGLLDVAELDPVLLSYRVLDVVAFRMRNDTAARLHLYGMTSVDEPAELAGTRSRAVKEYLASTWAIDQRRIEIRTGAPPLATPSQASSDGRQENRCVSFGSNSPYLLGSMVTQRLIREFTPPKLRIIPAFTAPAGARMWNVSVTKEGTVLSSFNGAGELKPGDDSLLWRLDEHRIDSSLGMLVATLLVTDSLGRSARAQDSVELRLKKESAIARSNTEVRGELERQVVELAGFGYRSETGGRDHLSAIATICSTVRNGAVIDITGYTDRIGDDNANRALSLERAEWVADRIREELGRRSITLAAVSTHGAGLAADRVSNDTPQGRILSRGVRVVVEQPIASSAPR